jgi:hypothetical protein
MRDRAPERFGVSVRDSAEEVGGVVGGEGERAGCRCDEVLRPGLSASRETLGRRGRHDETSNMAAV